MLVPHTNRLENKGFATDDAIFLLPSEISKYRFRFALDGQLFVAHNRRRGELPHDNYSVLSIRFEGAPEATQTGRLGQKRESAFSLCLPEFDS
jgi:hypothetical protein